MRRMRIYGAVLAVALLLAGCGQAEWTQFRGKDGRGRSASEISPPIGIKLELLLQPRLGSRRFFNQPLVAGDSAYFGSPDGNIYALDLLTGYMRWSMPSGGPINSSGLLRGSRVYFGSGDGKVYALDREDGKIIWTFQAEGPVNSTLVPFSRGLIAAADFDAFYLLNLDGELLGKIPNAAWTRNSFAVRDGVLAFAPGTEEDPGSLSAYDVESGEFLWSLAYGLEDYRWFSYPAEDRGSLYYSAFRLGSSASAVIEGPASQPLEFLLASIDAVTGAIRWETEDLGLRDALRDEGIPNPDLPPAAALLRENMELLEYGAPVVWRDWVLLAPGDSSIRSYRREDGRKGPVKTFETAVSTAPTLALDNIFFGLRAKPETGLGALVAAGADPGAGELWRIPVKGTIMHAPVIAGSRILFATDAGYFYVLEELFF